MTGKKSELNFSGHGEVAAREANDACDGSDGVYVLPGEEPGVIELHMIVHPDGQHFDAWAEMESDTARELVKQIISTLNARMN